MIDFQECYYRELGLAVVREIERVNCTEYSSIVEFGENQDELLFEFEYSHRQIVWWRLLAFRNNVRCDTNFKVAKLITLLEMKDQEKSVK